MPYFLTIVRMPAAEARRINLFGGISGEIRGPAGG
jgi:hypothetical protein